MVSPEARYRLLYEARNNPELQAQCIAASKASIVFWVNHFCYTYDPRDGKGDLPFNLYPFQEWFLEILVEKIRAQKDIDIEKSRTMGVSYLVAYAFQWFWLFEPGSSFLIGSITEQDVDQNMIDPENTLFGKLRYNLEYLPKWMLPAKGYKDNHLILKNLDNGNVIQGKASTPNFGRGARKTAIFFDEIAFWQWGRAAYDSASQTTRCRIMNSTPNGKYDVYGERMTSKDAKRITWPGRAELVKQKGLNDGGD
jgi:phage terminase large subunit